MDGFGFDGAVGVAGGVVVGCDGGDVVGLLDVGLDLLFWLEEDAAVLVLLDKAAVDVEAVAA